MEQTPPPRDPSRLVRFVERHRALPPAQKRSAALFGAALATALFVGALLGLRVWQGNLAAAREAARATAPSPTPIKFPL